MSDFPEDTDPPLIIKGLLHPGDARRERVGCRLKDVAEGEGTEAASGALQPLASVEKVRCFHGGRVLIRFCR